MTDETEKKYFENEICQHEFTHQRIQRKNVESAHKLLFNKPIDTIAKSDSNSEMLAAHGTVTHSTVTLNAIKNGAAREKTGKEVVAAMANEHLKISNEMVASQNKEYSKPALLHSLSRQSKEASQATVPFASSTRQRFRPRRSQKMHVDSCTMCCQSRKTSQPTKPATSSTRQHFTGQRSQKVLTESYNLSRQSKNASQTTKPATLSIRKQFTGRRSQKLHVERTTSTSFYCERCQTQFKRKVDLHTHQIYLHNKPSKHQCKKCGKYLPNASHLGIHMSYHEGIRNYPCQLCPKRFYCKSHLTMHMRIHSDDRPFKCEVCGKKYRQGNTLRIHMRLHTGEKPLVCKKCGKAFRWSSSHKAHMKTHISKSPVKKLKKQ